MVDGFETRKAAILHKAFTGELTAKWRKENGVSDDSWVVKLFDSCIAKMQNGLSKRSGNEGEETVVLRLANMGEDDFDVSDLRTIKLTSKEKNNYSLAKNDVVMIRVNGSKTNVGRQLLVKNNKGWSFCDHIIRIQFEVFCLPNYMVYFSKTKEYIDYVQDNMVSSAGQNTISRKGLSNLSLKVPTLPEQVEIVRILDIIIEKENKAKQAAEAVLEQIDLLKKSILVRAFRGEL
ncbi:restriction endonuclease subunit S [bacterium]|nr:restriction endonuclease subunit S [bacterium]